MGAIPPAPHMPRMQCPRCRAWVAGDATGVGIIFACPACGLEWVEAMPLDFSND